VSVWGLAYEWVRFTGEWVMFKRYGELNTVSRLVGKDGW